MNFIHHGVSLGVLALAALEARVDPNSILRIAFATSLSSSPLGHVSSPSRP
jgi:hypothetical protein